MCVTSSTPASDTIYTPIVLRIERTMNFESPFDFEVYALWDQACMGAVLPYYGGQL